MNPVQIHLYSVMVKHFSFLHMIYTSVYVLKSLLNIFFCLFSCKKINRLYFSQVLHFIQSHGWHFITWLGCIIPSHTGIWLQEYSSWHKHADFRENSEQKIRSLVLFQPWWCHFWQRIRNSWLNLLFDSFWLNQNVFIVKCLYIS